MQQHTTIPSHVFGSSPTVAVDWAQVDVAAREILSDAQWRVFTQVPGTNGKGAYGGGRFDNVLYRAIEEATRSEKGVPPRSE